MLFLLEEMGELLLRIRKMKVGENMVGSSIYVIATGANAIPLGGATAEDQEDEGRNYLIKKIKNVQSELKKIYL